MRLIMLVLCFILLTNVSFAKECIVNTTTDIVREWTTGVYCETPPMSIDEELKTFISIPSDYTKVLKYENGDIVVTNIDVIIIDEAKEKLLKMLDDPNIKDKIKNIKNL